LRGVGCPPLNFQFFSSRARDLTLVGTPAARIIKGGVDQRPNTGAVAVVSGHGASVQRPEKGDPMPSLLNFPWPAGLMLGAPLP
jgi:hypothetical protein